MNVSLSPLARHSSWFSYSSCSERGSEAVSSWISFLFSGLGQAEGGKGRREMRTVSFIHAWYRGTWRAS